MLCYSDLDVWKEWGGGTDEVEGATQKGMDIYRGLESFTLLEPCDS